MYIYDYETRRGETFEECFYVVDTDDKPADLSGFYAKGQVRDKKEGTKYADFHCDIDPQTACVRYVLEANETKAIPEGNYEYDICLHETVSGEVIVKYFIGGKFKVLKAVTDALSA